MFVFIMIFLSGTLGMSRYVKNLFLSFLVLKKFFIRSKKMKQLLQRWRLFNLPVMALTMKRTAATKTQVVA